MQHKELESPFYTNELNKFDSGQITQLDSQRVYGREEPSFQNQYLQNNQYADFDGNLE